MLITIIRPLLYFVGRLLSKLLLKVTVLGRENLPQQGPLIVVGNHFSLFDAPIIDFHLPYKIVFLSAADLSDIWLFRIAVWIADSIPIWRGRVDRDALRKATTVLEKGGVLGLFPEGGIDPDLMDKVGSGEAVQHAGGQDSRLSGQLICARPGAAYLATLSQAPILPVALLGTEKILGNLRRLRRTAVTLTIGPVFGPLSLVSSQRGPAKRQALNLLGDGLMQHIADLMPAENRGPYGEREE